MTPFKKVSFQTRVLPGRIKYRRLAFLFVTLQERIDEKVNFSRYFCLLLRYASPGIKYTKAAKAKLHCKPQIKVVIVQLKSMRFRRLHD